MSITNFETITEDISEEEKKIANNIAYRIKTNYIGKKNAVKANIITEAYAKVGRNLTDVRIRKIINWLRINGVPICSTSKGYYYPASKEEILVTIQSLEERARQIQRSADGMKNLINNL